MTDTSTDIQKSIDAYRVTRQLFRDENPDLLFAGYDTIHCIDCAGATLEASIVTGRKGQKTFKGMYGVPYRRLEGAELDAEKKYWEESNMTLACECGKVKA